MKPSRGKFAGIVIHHSATADTGTKSWEAIRRHHVETQGWDAIGYHFGVEEIDGETVILSGRGLEWQGAHTAGRNDAIGVCIVGDYDRHAPDMEKSGALVRLVLGLMEVYDLTPDQVWPHHAFAHKTCPGSCFGWDDFHATVEALWSQAHA